MEIKQLIQRYFLFFTVFITGACVLIVEVTALRVLSPYFGNTIFTASSVITVILAALSLGYWVGGTLSDRNPSLALFFEIIALGGFSLFLLNSMSQTVLLSVNSLFDFASGPLISSTILFFFPAFLLGSLSPFAIKLQHLRYPSNVGSIAGKIFFWSTLGSIVGSLSSGFYLIPHFGINQIISYTSLLLIILGCIPLFFLFSKEKKTLKLLIFASIAIVSVGFGLKSQATTNGFLPPSAGKVVYQKDGMYEKITLSEATYQNRPARFLFQDKSMSAAEFLDEKNPADLAFNYTKYYELYNLINPDIKNVLVIGGGAYSIPKAIHYEKPEANIDVAEIEPSLPQLAKAYFDVSDTSKITTLQEDGRRLLAKSNKKYDVIFSDVYNTIYSIPYHFTTKEFFQLAKDKMNDNGIFIANIIGDLSRQDDSFALSEIKTFQEAFPNSYFFAVDDPYFGKGQNLIFLGIKGDQKINFDDATVKNNQNEIISQLGKHVIDLNRFEFSPYPVLTDNFAPVEYMIGQFLARNSLDDLDGKETVALVAQELRYGPRYLTAPGHKSIQDFLVAEASGIADQITVQKWDKIGADGKIYELKNIVARMNPAAENRILLGTHYDSTKLATRDKTHLDQSPPGANNSASGTAVLLELLRDLKDSQALSSNIGLDVVFFDGEEGEEMQGGDSSHWSPLGSTYFSEHLAELYPTKKPEEATIIDMVCSKNMKIAKEPFSLEGNQQQIEDFWNIARKVNPTVFSTDIGPSVQDDQTPLNKAGIPSFLLIDFNYPYLYTTQDTLDKCSAESLGSIGKALKNYIIFKVNGLVQ